MAEEKEDKEEGEEGRKRRTVAAVKAEPSTRLRKNHFIFGIQQPVKMIVHDGRT